MNERVDGSIAAVLLFDFLVPPTTHEEEDASNDTCNRHNTHDNSGGDTCGVG